MFLSYWLLFSCCIVLDYVRVQSFIQLVFLHTCSLLQNRKQNRTILSALSVCQNNVTKSSEL